MAEEIESILQRLLLPDSAVIRQATADLQASYQNPAIVGALCHILRGSHSPQIRQLAAVLLRRKIVKLWRGLSVEEKTSIKSILLESLANETGHLVRVSVAYLVGVLANYELAHSQWVELLQFMLTHCQSAQQSDREMGMMLISTVLESAAIQLQPHMSQLLQLMSQGLEDQSSKNVPYYAIKSLTAAVEYIRHEDMQNFQLLVPKCMAVIKLLIVHDESHACEAMELFDEMIECELSLVGPHLQLLVQFCLEIASNQDHGDSIRVKALSFISWLVTLKKRTLIKRGLLMPILHTLLPIMASPIDPDEQEEEEELDADSSRRPFKFASQVLDVLALHLPPEKIFTPVAQLIQPWLVSQNCHERKAALIAVAVMSEGCAIHIKSTCLSDVVQLVYRGLNDGERIVRNAALFALGQLSEHLQTEVVKFSAELLPALFQFLDHSLSTSTQSKSSISRVFYALETFSENLGSSLLPHVPGLMEKLLLVLSEQYDIHLKELAVSAIGAVANAIKSDFAPYFTRTVEELKKYLALPYHQDHLLLQAQAVDTLGTLARTVGPEQFSFITEDSILLGVELIKSTDPDLRRSVYGMLASVSTVGGIVLSKYLETIVPRMLESLRSQEGVQVHYASNIGSFLDFDKNQTNSSLDDSQQSLDDDGDIEGYSVENAYLEEKEDTCNAIAEMMENLGSHFLPYMDDCYKELDSLTEHSSEDIRKAAINAQGRMCAVWYRVLVEGNHSEDDRANLKLLVNVTLASMGAIVRTDMERSVVIATLETLEDVLKSLKKVEFPVEVKVLESVLVSVEDVLERKAECQGVEDEEGGGEGDDEEGGCVAEYDGLLLECAGSVLGPLTSVVGGATILPRLVKIIQLLQNKLAGNKSSVSERSFAVGTLAEIVEGMGSHSTQLMNLLPLFMQCLSDCEDEVVSNSVFGLGLLASLAMPAVLSHYPTILQALFKLAQTRPHGRLIDNVCGAVCRMVVAQKDKVPLDQVVPVLLHNLPLKEDMEENKTVYSCLFQLLQEDCITVMQNLHLVLRTFALDLSPSSRLSQELQTQIMEVTAALCSQRPQQFQKALSLLPQEQAVLLTSVFNNPS